MLPNDLATADEAATEAVSRTRSPSRWLLQTPDGKLQMIVEAHNVEAAVEKFHDGEEHVDVFPLRPGYAPDDLPLKFAVSTETVVTTSVKQL